MRITVATKRAMDFACKHFHYSKSTPVNPIAYNVYNGKDEWCGCILYARGANFHLGEQYGLCIGQVLELVRVALNGKQEATSQAVAMSLKQLKKDCPMCRLIISYADCDQDHLGTIYQATNWIYVGELNKDDVSAFMVHTPNGLKKMHRKSIHSRIIIVDGKKMHCPQTIEAVRKYLDPDAEEFHTKGKRKYLMPLDKAMRKQILPLSQPYPKKDEDWHKIDRTQFHKDDKD